MNEQEKKNKIKVVDTSIGVKFIVGVEEAKPIEASPVTYVEDITSLENGTNFNEKKDEDSSFFIPPKAKVTYSYGYVNYIWYGIISVGLALMILFILLKK